MSQNGDNILIFNTTGTTSHDTLFVNALVDGVNRLYVAHITLPSSATIAIHIGHTRPINWITLCGIYPDPTHDDTGGIISVEVVGP